MRLRVSPTDVPDDVLLLKQSFVAYSINNRVWTLAIGGGLPANLRNTTDDTFYTHYSCISTVEANWGLGSLGRGDTNATLNNVFSWVANATGWKNNGISANSSAIRKCIPVCLKNCVARVDLLP